MFGYAYQELEVRAWSHPCYPEVAGVRRRFRGHTAFNAYNDYHKGRI